MESSFGTSSPCTLIRVCGAVAQVPPEWVSLYMLQKPKNGGDTIFASTVGAYERLTPDQKKLVDSLEVVNRYTYCIRKQSIKPLPLN